MRSWKIVAVLLLCLLLVSSIACNPFGGDAEENSQQLVEVVRGDLMVTVSGSGTIEVSNERKLVFGSGGKIDRLYVSESDKVSKGDMLAKLDTSTLELALIQARVARDEAEYNLNQLNVYHASQDMIEIAKSQLEAAERAVTEAQKQIDEATLIAPFGGVVASVYTDEDDIVSPGMPIIHLIDLTSMELSAEVDEIDIPGVKLGQRAIIEVDALPDARLEGKVISISTLSVEVAGVVLYGVTIGFDVPEAFELKPGMSASVDIVTSERNNVLLVPDRAIAQDSQGNPVVKVVVDEEIEERPVTIGISDGLDTEIIDGLDEGELVMRKAS